MSIEWLLRSKLDLGPGKYVNGVITRNDLLVDHYNRVDGIECKKFGPITFVAFYPKSLGIVKYGVETKINNVFTKCNALFLIPYSWIVQLVYEPIENLPCISVEFNNNGWPYEEALIIQEDEFDQQYLNAKVIERYTNIVDYVKKYHTDLDPVF